MATHPIALNRAQQELVERPLESRLFLHGPAGSGKTTAGVARLERMVRDGAPADAILVLAPQRTLAAPYYDALQSPRLPAGGLVSVLTIGGLARRMLELFFPLIAEEAGFGMPDQAPTFLTLETAQYFMSKVVRPMLDQGSFSGLVINPHRLYSQILDNLNKAAAIGFPARDIGRRLLAASDGEISRQMLYADAQLCADRFREFCLEHNLLDFSLQLEIFSRFLWPKPLVRDYLLKRYRYLLIENVEEDIPLAHDILREWLPSCSSVLLIFDDEGGYRRFLGADPDSASALRSLCRKEVTMTESLVTPPELQALAGRLSQAITRKSSTRSTPLEELDRRRLDFSDTRFHPQMLDWVAEEIARLVREEGLSAGEIVVLAPFMPDSLRFSLNQRLEKAGIRTQSHRPSRPLSDEPAARCLLTLASLAHPQWEIQPSLYDVAYAFMQAIDGLDAARAYLLSKVLYHPRAEELALKPFDGVNAGMQNRITYLIGERYEDLRKWLEAYHAQSPLPFDHFLSRLFGEVLSQPGFGFHHQLDAAAAAASLIESARKFRWTASAQGPGMEPFLGREYLQQVQNGLLAAQYLERWQESPAEAVLLAPATTFLMANRPVEVQFWLDVGSKSWYARLNQPLTHPYVLSRSWPAGKLWGDEEETEAETDTLNRLVLGLLRRCRGKVYLGISELDEQGNEQRERLLRAWQHVLRAQVIPGGGSSV